MKQLFTFIVVTFFSLYSIAQTNIGGTLTKDTKLSLAGSPYTVTSNLGVPSGIELTIDTGVTVNFNGTAQLIIQGSLIANGTASHPISFNGKGGIMFQKTNLSLSSLSNISMDNSVLKLFNIVGDTNWGILPINFLNASNSEIITETENKSNAELIINNSKIFKSKIIEAGEIIKINTSSIFGCQLNSFSKNGIFYTTDSISNSYFLMDSYTVSKLSIANSFLYNSNFTTNNGAWGIPKLIISGTILKNVSIQMEYLEIKNSKIYYDSNYQQLICITSGRGEIEYCEFFSSNSLIALEKRASISFYKISNCTFIGFKTNFKINNWTQTQGGNNVVTINNCNFFDRPKSYFIENLSPYDINASNNYWGTNSDSIIGASVYDYWDDILFGKVIYTTKLYVPVKFEYGININSITVTPNTPFVNNNIKIITKTTVNGFGQLVDKIHFIRHDTVFLKTCYSTLIGAGPVIYLDTFDIGMLSPNNYKIYYSADLSNTSDNCSAPFDRDIKVSTFTTNSLILNSVTIKPALPNPQNIVKVYSNVTLGGVGKKVSKEQVTVDGIMHLNVCYYVVPGQTSKYYNDTFILGTLNVGVYSIIVTASITSNPDSCEKSYSKSQYSSLIIKSTGIESISNQSKIQINPNPFNTKITLSGEPVKNYAILNSIGQVLKSDEINGASNPTINLETLPVGAYTILITLQDGMIYREKILKN